MFSQVSGDDTNTFAHFPGCYINTDNFSQVPDFDTDSE